MGETTSLPLLMDGLRLAAVLATPVALAALLSGLLTGLLQSLTAWSDAALSYVPRLTAVAVAWTLTGPWVARELTAFAARAWGGPS